MNTGEPRLSRERRAYSEEVLHKIDVIEIPLVGYFIDILNEKWYIFACGQQHR